jgi:hypothetical protein
MALQPSVTKRVMRSVGNRTTACANPKITDGSYMLLKQGQK